MHVGTSSVTISTACLVTGGLTAEIDRQSISSIFCFGYGVPSNLIPYLQTSTKGSLKLMDISIVSHVAVSCTATRIVCIVIVVPLVLLSMLLDHLDQQLISFIVCLQYSRDVITLLRVYE